MSTEKSLLTWEHVNGLIPTIEEIDGSKLCLPIGIDEDGRLMLAELDSTNGNQHLAIIGRTGSGKSVATMFTLMSMIKMYGDKVCISYIDGKDCEMRVWENVFGEVVFPNHDICRGVTDYKEMHDTLTDLHYRLYNKCDNAYELIVFDDVDYLIRTFTKEDISLLRDIINKGPEVNMHMFYTTQSFCSPTLMFERLGELNDWSYVCATRVDMRMSDVLFNTDMAANGVRKHGDLVVKHNDVVQKLKVPFVSNRDMEEFKESLRKE